MNIGGAVALGRQVAARRREAEEARVELIVCRHGPDGGYFSDVTGHQKGGNLRSSSEFGEVRWLYDEVL